jgi:hypothetical protein
MNIPRCLTIRCAGTVACVLVLMVGCTKTAGGGEDPDASGTDASGTDASGTDASGSDASGTDASGTDAATGVCPPGDTRPCGSDVGACQTGLETCDAAGAWGLCMGQISPVTEICNSVDDNCDGDVDENLDTDFGVFAGCANYRYLIDSSQQWLDGNAAAATNAFWPTVVADMPSIPTAAFGLIARAEFHLQSNGLPLPTGARKDLIDQALDQTDALWDWEASQPTPTSLRQGAGNTHTCRGWFGALASYTSIVNGQTHPAYTVSTYYTGPVLYGYALLARAIFTDPPAPAADYLAAATTLNDRVSAVINHWFTTQTPNDHFWASYPSDGTENWFCETEFEDDCMWGGQRFVKWNTQTWMWRAVALWNDNARDFQSSTVTVRRTRAMRYARWMKKDMLDSSSPWSNTSPYWWHSWADWDTAPIWNYIEDASHGAWDVGLMVEAWRGDWRFNTNLVDSNDESYFGLEHLMGPGSASRFRHTYLDNLAIAGDPCVWQRTDGAHLNQLATGRRRALSEWIPMAAGDETFLMELQEDITGVCDGYAPISPAVPRPENSLAFVRLWTEARAIRGE